MVELTPQPSLVSLTAGIPELCEPMTIEDITGPHSYFGTSQLVSPQETREGITLQNSNPFLSDFCSGSVLWEADAPLDNSAIQNLAVPVPTYLAGTCGSTFSVAWKLAEVGLLKPFSGVLSNKQDSARGQMRKVWVSPKGNLSVSFLLPTSSIFFDEAGAIILGMLIILALRKSGYNLFLKWPNDLIDASNHKCGGILLEEKNGMVIAGLGINLNEAPSTSHNAMGKGLPASTIFTNNLQGKSIPSSFFLWQSLVFTMVKEYYSSVKYLSKRELLEQTNAFMAWKGQHVFIVEEEEPTIEGVCLGLGPHGGLNISTAHGSTKEIFSGHVRLEK